MRGISRGSAYLAKSISYRSRIFCSVASTAFIPLSDSSSTTASGIPPQTWYLRYSSISLLWIVSGTRSIVFRLATKSNNAGSDALKNSVKEIGYILIMDTFPTGTVILRRRTATPSREPAARIWYWGALSQKYLRLLNAASHSCISSNTMSVLPGSIGTSVCKASSFSRRFGSLVWLKMVPNSRVSLKSK